MIQIALAFAEIVEAEFIYRVRTEGPCVAQVPLLRTRLEERTETGHGRASSLERGEGIGGRVVLKIVVSGKLLRGVDLVVNANGELVRTLGFLADLGNIAVAQAGSRIGGAIAVVCELGDPLVIDRESGRVEASDRNLLARENVREQGSSRNWGTATACYRLLAG